LKTCHRQQAEICIVAMVAYMNIEMGAPDRPVLSARHAAVAKHDDEGSTTIGDPDFIGEVDRQERKKNEHYRCYGKGTARKIRRRHDGL
jgi:hypothetical protein